MRQTVKVVVAALVVLALVLSAFGCTSTPATPTTAPAAATKAPAAPAPTAAAPAPAQATAAPAATKPAAAPTTGAAVPAGQVIELKLHHHDPPTSPQHQKAQQVWADLIGQKSGGKVHITVYPAETLGKSTTAIDMAQNGVADLAWGFIGNHPGKFPITDILGLPMLGQKSGIGASKAVWEAYKTIPEIRKDWENLGLHVIFLHTGAPQVIGSTKPIGTMEQLKGQRLRAITGAPLKFLQALGASPVNVPMPEVFEAVQKGTIDGYCTDWAGIGGFKFDEVSKYVLDDTLYTSTFYMVMSQKKWDSLPPDVQQVFNEWGGDYASDLYGHVWQQASDDYKAAGVKKGIQLVKLTPDELAKWQAKAPGVWDEYIKIVDSKGYSGQDLITKVKALYAKYNE